MKKIGILLVFIIILFTSCNGTINYTSEGSSSNPVALTLDVTHSGQISGESYSYYSFRTESAGTYTISLTNLSSDLRWELYSDSTFSYDSYLQRQDSSVYIYDEVAETEDPLNADTTYYVRVEEWDGVAGGYSLRISTPS